MPRHFEISSLPNVRAVVTTKWDRKYTSKIIRQVEGFYVDSSIDNDADSWEITLGDPTGEYLAMMNRDAEVRLQLLSSEKGAAGHIMTGIADDLTYNQDGAFSITGRDYASLALDSTAEPYRWKKVKPQYVIANQARMLGFPASSLNDISKWKKVIKTDGSETYWEFWFRLVRNDKAYMWVGPNGTLILNKLAYTDTPTYYFGTPQNSDSEAIKYQHIPVEGIEIRKSTQGRVHTCWVYAHNGKFQIAKAVTDRSIDGWVRRPTKIIQDTVSHTEKGVKKTAWNEIYEGKVGSVEIRLVTSNPQFVISCNKMARIRIPEIDVFGTYFIVGTRFQAGKEGYVQEIRLREKNMALSRRVPQEPKIPQLIKRPANLATPDHQSGIDMDAIDAKLLAGLIPGDDHDAWADFFFKAAREHQGQWDFDIFLAALLSIAYLETKIKNIREKGMNIGVDGIEWWPHFPGGGRTTIGQNIGKTISAASGGVFGMPAYEKTFANEKGTHGLNKEASVGIMQLRAREWKRISDDYYSNYANDPGVADQNAMALNINAYFERKKPSSPLIGYGSQHVLYGKKYGVDPRLLVAISGAETGFATTGDDLDIFNAWGYAPGQPEGTFESWEDGIEHVLKVLGTGNYYIADGNTTVASIGANYAPIDAENDPQGLNKNWVPTVTKFMSEQRGNPQDVRWPKTTATLADHGHNEYYGGRWDPEANIFTGAKFLKECLDATNLTPQGGTDQVAAMALAYTRYATGSINSDSPLVRKFKQTMQTEPNFLSLASEATKAVKQAYIDAGDEYTDGITKISGSGEPGDVTEEEALGAFTGAASNWEPPTYAPGTSSIGPPTIATGMPPVTLLLSKNFVKGRVQPIRWIVIHTMEIEETGHTAEDLAGQYASGRNEVAVHYCIDNNTIVQCVRDTDTGRGILVSNVGFIPGGASGNEISISVEHAGWASRSAAEWGNDYHQDMLKLSARLVGRKAKAYGIARKRLSVAEIQAGDSGIVAHGDIYTAYTEGPVRTDPGPNFPWTQYINWVVEAANAD